jgi:ferredoxin
MRYGSRLRGQVSRMARMPSRLLRQAKLSFIVDVEVSGVIGSSRELSRTCPSLQDHNRRARPRLVRSDNLKQEVAKHVRALGASVVGFAPVERWAAHGEVPESYRPEAIWPMARTVVVFGVPMLLPVLESTPSINYQEMYDTSNRLLDDIGYRLATWLCERGHATVFLPRDGYGSLDVLLENPFGSFSHTYAAKYAGLGTVGVSRNLLTPQWGPARALRLGIHSPQACWRQELSDELCNRCGICERLCPTQAIRARADRNHRRSRQRRLHAAPHRIEEGDALALWRLRQGVPGGPGPSPL